MGFMDTVKGWFKPSTTEDAPPTQETIPTSAAPSTPTAGPEPDPIIAVEKPHWEPNPEHPQRPTGFKDPDPGPPEPPVRGTP